MLDLKFYLFNVNLGSSDPDLPNGGSWDPYFGHNWRTCASMWPQEAIVEVDPDGVEWCEDPIGGGDCEGKPPPRLEYRGTFPRGKVSFPWKRGWRSRWYF